MANSNGWGDGAANNSIGWGQGANNAIAWGDSHAKSWAGATDIVGITTDPAAAAYFTSTGITGATQQTAIDNLVKGLKQDGLWSKMKAVYPFVTDNRNLLGYTEDFGNASWTKSDTNTTTNTTTAPNGTLTADKLTPNTTNIGHWVRQSISLTSGITQTATIYAKADGYNYMYLYANGSGSGQYRVFDLQNGTLGVSGGTQTASIENVGNGWYRCVLTWTPSTTTSANLEIAVLSTNSIAAFAGDGTSGIFVWGAQLELGSTATTYQPIATTQQAFISNQFKYNLVNPVDSDAAFRLVFNGGWTHSANGATPNGTNGYADTKLNDSIMTPNSAHMSYYSRTNVLSSTYEIGIYNGTKGVWLGLRQSSTESFTGGIFQAGASGEASVSNTNSTGYYIGGKNGSTTTKFYKNGTNVVSIAKADTTATNTTIYLATLNQNGTPAFGFSSKQVAFSSIGDGLTDTEAANLYTRVQAFQTALSRQV